MDRRRSGCRRPFCRQSFRQGPFQGAGKPPFGPSADINDLMGVLQPGPQAGVQQGGFTHPRLAVQQDKRRRFGVGNPVVQVADIGGAAEKNSRVFAFVPLEKQKGFFRRLDIGRQAGQAEERIAAGRRQAPVHHLFGARAPVQFPGQFPGVPIGFLRAVHYQASVIPFTGTHFDLILGFGPGSLQRQAAGQALIEADRQLGCDRIVDRLRRTHHRRDARFDQFHGVRP